MLFEIANSNSSSVLLLPLKSDVFMSIPAFNAVYISPFDTVSNPNPSLDTIFKMADVQRAFDAYKNLVFS